MKINNHPICLGLFLATLGCSSPVLAQPGWQPQATERLVRLPADYMKKLVALDALALSEQIEDAELADSDIAEPADVASAVDFFIK